MIYCVDPYCDEPIMLINRQVGSDLGEEGVDGHKFVEELLELDSMGKKRIQVWINSYGGYVIDGMAIFNAILNTSTPVDTYNTGVAASIAGVIWMAGRKRFMNDYASLMMHDPSSSGSEPDKKHLKATKESLVTMLSARNTVVTPEEISDLMARTTWMNASECFEKGFATDLCATSEANRKRMPKTDVAAMWKAGTEITNNALKSKNMKFLKVTNKLNLVEDASEDAILASITGIENRATTAETALATAQAELLAAKTTVETLTSTVNTLEAAAKATADAAKLAEETAAETAIDAMVTNFAKLGKIKNDAAVITQWKATAKTIGIEEAKNILEGLPINKAAVKVEDKAPEGVGTYNAASVMQSITAKNSAKA